MNTQVKIDVIGLQKEVKKLAGRDRNIHAIKVYKSGNTLLDNTYNGYDKNEIHNVFSCTKSVLSILIGIAIDKAFIKTVDEKVVDLLFDYKKYFEGDKENMTLKDLLTMRSGIEWDEFAGFGRKDGIWLNFLRSEDPINYILSKALYENPDTNFNYNSGVSHLLSVIIESNTGLTTYDFANKYLFEPLAIKKSDIKWQVDKKNRVYGGHGLSMKIDDLEKIGVMYLNGGLYHGERIVSKSWTYESTLSHSKKTRGYAGYGYQFWIGHIKNEEFYGAFGHAGQRIYVFKDLDMVVTFLGNVKPEFGIQEKLIRNFIFDKQ